MAKSFPIISAGYIYNPFPKEKILFPILTLSEVEINYPCRLDAMAINPSAVVYNDDMVFTSGEVVISINKYIKVKIKVIDKEGGILKISSSTKRRSLVKHSYLLMCSALNVSPSLEIDVDSNSIPKHCGFGSSSSTITAVACAINEIYNRPIDDMDLIKYLASNHGEEINDSDENHLKVVQCIGGGATNGLTEEGIIIIAGKSTTIAKMKYEGEVLICLPKDYVQKDAKLLMELEEKNLWKFKKTGDKYAEKIAFQLLHRALPDMANGSIKELANVVYNYRFNMGSNDNCSFVYDGLVQIGNKLRVLYEQNDCEFLALSSVGPAFFTIVKNKNEKKKCIQKMKELELDIIPSTICNTKYIVLNKNIAKNYWQQEDTNIDFQEKPVSKYITDEIDKLLVKNKKCIDIGCGGGRYSKYLFGKGARVLSIDKYPEMIGNVYKNEINFIKADMDNIPVKDCSYDLALSIGVIHNSVSIEEFYDSLKEIYRVLVSNGICIMSVFTDDLITDDLIKQSENIYSIIDRPPMVLYSQEKINQKLSQVGFKNIRVIDKHVTNVESGERYVYTITFQK